MSGIQQDEVENRLLRSLPPQSFSTIAPHLQAVDFPKADVLAELGDPVTDAYFPDSGVISMVAVSPEGLEAEAGLVGREGFAPTSLLMGAQTSPHRINVQLPGRAWKIEACAFLAVVDADPDIRRLLMRFVQTLIVQASCTALSNAVHGTEERLARWILMCDDRSDEIGLPLTHEFMAVMLAVRRPTVTTALHVLEGNGYLRSERGCVVVKNRTALEAFAGDAYGQPEAEYRKLIGPFADAEVAPHPEG